jgi:hypothetical protein
MTSDNPSRGSTGYSRSTQWSERPANHCLCLAYGRSAHDQLIDIAEHHHSARKDNKGKDPLSNDPTSIHEYRRDGISTC